MKTCHIVKSLLIGVGATLILSVSSLAQGVVVADRSMLNALLGMSRVDENFETPNILVGGGVGGDGLLNSTNSTTSWGSGLVVPGVTFESIGDSGNYVIEWYGNEAGPGTTQTLRAGLGLRLDFWEPVTTFGLDLKDYPSTRTVLMAGISIYGVDDSTLLYQNDAFTITDPANGNFFGYQNPGGIGSVVFSVTSPGPNYTYKSPFIDNLSFSPVPEPSTAALGLLACGALAVLARKRRVL